MQNTSKVLMIRPHRFAYNSQTAVNNLFQTQQNDTTTQQKALIEFDGFVAMLRRAGVEVIVADDTPEPHTPDAVFPNNWISFHTGHTICLYPMFAENRRQERKPELIKMLIQQLKVETVADFTHYENENKFLEGTGSMVLDRVNKMAYACLSPRTDETVLNEWCERMHYSPVVFHAQDATGHPIYHTNVMMCVADRYVVICLECIPESDRGHLIKTLEASGKEIISITLQQMEHFAGNMLQVLNQDGSRLLVMSSQAFTSLSVAQVDKLSSYNQIIHAPIPTIESNGGGSARCMMAEIFL